jgi:hypothetical protein
MSLSKEATCKNRIKKAQAISIDWTEACSPRLLESVSAHCDAVGAPKHFIYFHGLRALVSALMTSADVGQENHPVSAGGWRCLGEI